MQRCSSANRDVDCVTSLPARAGPVAQAPRAGRARTPWSSSPCWRPSSRTARFRDQLQLDDEANSQIADGSDLGTCRPQVTSVGDLPTSSVSAVQLIPETLCSVPTPPVTLGKPAQPLYNYTIYLYFRRDTIETLQIYHAVSRTHSAYTPGPPPALDKIQYGLYHTRQLGA